MRISLIIPVYEEQKILKQTIERALSLGLDEVLVVDASADDQCQKIAQEFSGLRYLRSAKGRARQMNLGASEANGDVLLFVHADVALPQNALLHIQSALADEDMLGGRFRLRFDSSAFSMGFHGFCTRFAFFSFGDQAFFVRKDVFDSMQGFDEQAYFEDVDFYKRLRQEGQTQIIRESVIASARRYEQMGPVKQKLINVFLLVMALLNCDPRPVMRKVYPDVR